MPTAAPASIVEFPAADAQARENWHSNRLALMSCQPRLVELLSDAEVEQDWVFARDGSLTALTCDGHWFGDCSVPLLTGRALLKNLEARHVGSCLLLPGNAGLVVAARERVGATAPLFVIQPDPQIARMILTCEDFSVQIRRHRLWIVTGPAWAEQLSLIFAEHPGLATPQQFIRTRLTTESIASPIITAAEQVFSSIANQRAPRIASLANQPGSANPKNILLIGSTEFRLWDFGTAVLHRQLAGQSDLSVNLFDTDEPMNTSPLALLAAARECGTVVTANICRADSNQPVSREIPWITWITQPVVPSFHTAGPKDGLIVADAAWRDRALKAGWAAHRVKVCGWPITNQAHISSRQLAMIVDTQAIEIPASIKQFSSHRLLWDLIEEELRTNPFAVRSIDAYVTNRAGQLNIPIEAIDRARFSRGLILPAYQQGLARTLLKANVPLSIWGRGWNDLEEFTNAAHGPVTHAQEFDAAVGESAGLIYCWPDRHAHPIDSVGKPIIFAGEHEIQFTRDAQRVLSGSNRKAPIANGSLYAAVSQLIHSN